VIYFGRCDAGVSRRGMMNGVCEQRRPLHGSSYTDELCSDCSQIIR